MTPAPLSPTQRKAAFAAGLLYLFVILGSMIYMSAVRPKLIVPRDPAATVASLSAHGPQFRAGTTFELLMAAAVIALAWALWVLLKPVDEGLAALGLGLRVVEGTLWAGLTVLSHAALQVASSPGLEPGTKAAWVGVLVGSLDAGMNTVVLFTGLGTFVFCALLYKARVVPRWLAAWGLLTYASMIVYSCAKLVDPGLAGWDRVVYTPGGIFEMVIGAWLLVLGLQRREAKA